jgi:hypothetical protein
VTITLDRAMTLYGGGPVTIEVVPGALAVVG